MTDPNDPDVLTMTEHLARDGFPTAREYFRNPSDAKHAEYVSNQIKVMSIHSRERATRANEAAVTLGVARMMGLEGAALAPLWEQLTGCRAEPHSPPPRERSGDDERQAR